MKFCTKCQQNKSNHEFYTNKKGLNVWCKKCEKMYRKQRYAKRKATITQSSLTEKTCTKCKQTKLIHNFVTNFDRKDGYDIHCNQCKRDSLRTPHGKMRRMLYTAKQRALKLNIPFNLTVDDLKFPDMCPVLNIPFCLTHPPGGPKDDAPSLDRIVPQKGYIKGNVIIVSQRANRLKNDANLEEMQQILEFYTNLIKDKR